VDQFVQYFKKDQTEKVTVSTFFGGESLKRACLSQKKDNSTHQSMNEMRNIPIGKIRYILFLYVFDGAFFIITHGA